MRAWLFMLLVACGTTRAPSPEEAPEQSPSQEATPEAEHADPSEADPFNEAAEGDEAPTAVVVAEGPRNFLTPHHCHPPGPCSFEFEVLRGAQHIDVGHGHPSAPRLDIVLRVGSGQATLDGVAANMERREARGLVVARSRDSLEGGAYYVTLNGDSRVTEVELSFRSE